MGHEGCALRCVAAAEITSDQWVTCASLNDEGTVLEGRVVFCAGFLVVVRLCPAHRRLWDAAYKRQAIWAGAPVVDSRVTG